MLQSLTIQSVRNLSAATILPTPRVNIIHGVNASGKTSLLEAIYFLGTGRSFRSPTKHLLQHNQSSCIVAANYQQETRDISLGIQRDIHGSTTIKVGGKKINSIRIMSDIIPLSLIDNHLFNLLDGSPSERRKFLNWGLFYQQPSFFQLWRNYYKCLGQRNALLKQGYSVGSRNILAGWDKQLVALGTRLDVLYQNYVHELTPLWNEVLNALTAINGLNLHYTCGWAHKNSFATCLDNSLAQDYARGFTHYGAHKTDIKIMLGSQLAQSILSRGQKKLVVCALLLAQGLLLEKTSTRRVIYLIDDLTSELDMTHRIKFCHFIEQMQTQVFLTAIEKSNFSSLWYPATAVKLFHLNKGELLD